VRRHRLAVHFACPLHATKVRPASAGSDPLATCSPGSASIDHPGLLRDIVCTASAARARQHHQALFVERLQRGAATSSRQARVPQLADDRIGSVPGGSVSWSSPRPEFLHYVPDLRRIATSPASTSISRRRRSPSSQCSTAGLKARAGRTCWPAPSTLRPRTVSRTPARAGRTLAPRSCLKGSNSASARPDAAVAPYPPGHVSAYFFRNRWRTPPCIEQRAPRRARPNIMSASPDSFLGDVSAKTTVSPSGCARHREVSGPSSDRSVAEARDPLRPEEASCSGSPTSRGFGRESSADSVNRVSLAVDSRVSSYNEVPERRGQPPEPRVPAIVRAAFGVSSSHSITPCMNFAHGGQQLPIRRADCTDRLTTRPRCPSRSRPGVAVGDGQRPRIRPVARRLGTGNGRTDGPRPRPGLQRILLGEAPSQKSRVSVKPPLALVGNPDAIGAVTEFAGCASSFP